MLHRVPRAAGRDEGSASHGARSDVLRPQLDSSDDERQPLLGTPGEHERKSQPGQRIGKIGLQPESLAMPRDRLLEPPLRAERVSQIIEGGDPARIAAQ